ncbi:hemagglutinin repeat-containing protein [Lelliottia sp. JS-SCA-14]|uniref:hemagglutinin repeat-containing protein n=1 Tax=Lelliottia sp. JS-SCA-14 TaxID=3110110 RepID=UPI002D7A168E|nr:hemagglutinin repeat-containing protein [Lelliottia sp. JS-SCA-14]
MDTRHPPVRLSQRLISWMVCSLMVWQPVAPAFAAVMTPGGKTTMDQAGNGVPVVNIAPPNGAGISHNQFNSYNVGKEGVILNNATDRLTQTQLGGLIQNNPNLVAGKEAKGIINEVTGGSRSQLQGYTEVGGKAASVMVANPYGITCNGCGFINTPNVTLTTGKPQFDANGNLLALDVSKGAITIEGQGLDASQSDALSIIARATEVNAAIHARDLTVTAGANRVGADGSVKAIAGEGAAPVIAVDTSALGGMYANRIRLVSSDKGVGVNLGNLNARQGDIQLDANGKLTVTNSLASGAITAKGAGVTLNGSHQSGGALNVASSQDIALNNSTLVSGGEMRLTNDGKLQMSGGSATSKAALTVNSSQDLTLNNATLGSDTQTTLTSGGTLAATGSAVSAGKNLTLKGQQLTLDNRSRADAAGNIDLSGERITSQGQLNAGGDLTSASQQLDNSGLMAAKGRASVQADSLTNSGTLQGNGVTLAGKNVINSGTVQSGGQLQVSAGTLSQQGTLTAKGDAELNASESLRNSGSVVADGALRAKAGALVQNGVFSGAKALTADADTLTSGKDSRTTSQGNIQLTAAQLADLNGQTDAAGALSVSGKNLTTRADAHLQSGQDLTLQANSVDLGGVQAAKGGLRASAQNLDHSGTSTAKTLSFGTNDGITQRGELTANAIALNGQRINQSGKAKADSITLTASDAIANSGTLVADALTLDGKQISNSGLLQGNSLLTLRATTLDNLTGGAIYSARNLTLNLPELNNSGLITTDTDLGWQGNALTNSGEINGVNLRLDGNSLTNQATGRLLADDALNVKGSRLLNDGQMAAKNLQLTGNTLQNQGVMQGYDILALNADEVTNGGAMRSDGTLTLRVATLTNSGELSATNLLLTLSRQMQNNSSGQIIARNGLTLATPELLNSGLLAGANVQLNAGTIANSGTLQGTTALTATGTQLNNQQNGKVLSGGDVRLQNDKLTNAGLLQGKTLNLATGEWINSGNALGEAGITATIAKSLTNDGNVLSQQKLDLNAANINNRGQLLAKVLTLRGDLQNSGLLQGSSALTWTGGGLTNQTQGQITGGETLTLSGKSLSNQGQIQARDASVTADAISNSGSVQALDRLTLNAGGRLDNQGTLLSQNLFELTAAQLFNDGQLAAKTLTLATPQLTNNGILQGNDGLTLTTRSLTNGQNGQLVSGGALALDLDKLENHGLMQVNQRLTVKGNDLLNSGDIQADALEMTLHNALNNQGGLVAKNDAALNAVTLTNTGTLAGKTLTLGATEIRNSGLIQGNDRADATASRISNDAAGKWLSGGALTLNGGTLSNAGALQGENLGLTGASLDNSGTVNGLKGLTGNLSGKITNTGLLQSGGAVKFTADSLLNPGRVMGKTLTLNARELNNSGLWQGTDTLTLTGDSLVTGAASKTLTGGALTLDAGQLTTQGTLQGNGVTVTADGWTHGGSLLSQGALTASVGGTLTSTGALMSQGDTAITAQTLDNRGQLLGEGDMRLGGSTLKNSGAVQGKTLALRQTSINNQGTLTGLQSLTLKAQQQLMARMAMAAPQLELINGASGALLTQGTLNITSGTVTNNGSWQGQNILLDAQSLTNNGAVQSADALQMTLANNLTNSAGSKITALGSATLQAMSLNNQGQWAAKNLTLKGTTLSNSGAISGVNGLTLAQTGAITQQQNGTMLTGGALNLNAASLANDGKIQGATLGVTSGALTNNGRLQGDNGATFSLSGALTNNAGGEIVSRQGLTVTTPSLFNYGLMQGGGDTNVTANTQARNDGKLLSGARLTLSTPQFTGAGWLQATNLILNAATATNGGTWLADQATLTGNTLVNQGTTQAGTLAVNYGQLTNSGTLLGNSQLTIDADQVTQSAAGKLLSGGDLWLESKGLDAVGQLVSLGNLTLKLTNAFTGKTAIAAGKTLSISSNGAIENRSVMQGQAVNLTAGGALTNNGQLTTGSGASALSGSTVALNGAGTIQGGGDIAIASRGNITVDGFTGTRGSLTLSAPGSIVNTALLYAANNLALYANSITNQRGDILAGNNLWMQKDAAGNANSEVVNTSGTIETQNGDISIKTGHLLNERAGLSASVTAETEITNQYSWLTQTEALVPLSYLDSVNYNYGYYRVDTGCANSCAGAYWSRPAPYKNAGDLEFAVSRSQVVVSSDGSAAARISSGRDALLSANTMENNASNILATKNIVLSGGTLNNQSWIESAQTRYMTYSYGGDEFAKESKITSQNGTGGVNYIYFTSRGNIRTEGVDGDAYRAVIQAGGNVVANFTSDISNTATTANVGGNNSTIKAPTLTTLSNQTIDGAAQKQNLANTGVVAVNSPQWNDQLQGALQQINGGGALDSSGASSASLSNISTSQKGNASLGQLSELAKAGVTTADLNTAKGGATGQYQGKTVDTSAYPLPSGNNGYFVVSDNPKSPYLINVNPKLNGLGQLDPALFADLNKMLGTQPSTSAPQETRAAFTDEKQVLGSSYMLGRLNLNPDYDYRFLGDAAFDTRYVSNTVLNQTGSRYLNGVGSDLDQMRYLMDSAAAAQQSLGLQFGVSLTADQIASLDHSILWWEKATINGETVMVPKVYLSPKDVTVNNGSVIAGNNVSLTGGNITNSGSTLVASNNLTLDSQNSISNLNNGLIKAGGDLNLSAIGDINNISSTISGKTVQLASLDGSINNLTLADQIDINAKGKYSNVSIKDTVLGTTASITAQDSLSLEAGKNITVTGANLASGGDMLMNAWGDIAVNANQINDAYSSSQAKTSRSSVTYQGSTVNAGGNLSINAGNNIDLSASDLKAGGSAGLNAGNDLNLNAEQTSTSSGKGKSESHSTGVDRTTISAGDNLVLKAGQDINSQAAGIAAEGDLAMRAGRDVNLLAEETTDGSSSRSKKKTVIDESVRQGSTEIASGGNTTIIAGRDVNSEAAQVTASDDLAVTAGRDVNITTATESDYHYKEERKTKSGFFKKTTTHTIEEDSATYEKGSSLSGDNVLITAGNDVTVKGSSVIGDKDLTLNAGHDVNIVAATEEQSTYRLKEKKTSGLMGSGGIGFTIGTSSSRHQINEDGTTQSQSVSTVGSTGGNVNIFADGKAHVSGADIIAAKNLNVVAGEIAVDPGNDLLRRKESYEEKKSGLTLSVSSVITDAALAANSALKRGEEVSDDRLAALYGVKAAKDMWVAGSGVASLAGGAAGGNVSLIRVELNIGSSKSQSTSELKQNEVRGSTLTAGSDVNMVATGKNTSGDLHITGSGVTGNNVTLVAQNDVILDAASNKREQTSSNNSSGWSAGAHVGIGKETGIGVQASGFQSKGGDDGTSTEHVNTRVNARDELSISSGRDTVIAGAQALGDKITADVGRDLLISSLQDTDDYHSWQKDVSGGVSFTFGTMTGSASLNIINSKIDSEYASVGEQSGLFAGNKGFDITVGKHTQLDGAVIASTATADKNSLDTGTLGWRDIDNDASYSSKTKGIGGLVPIIGTGSKGDASGTTNAAIADGTISVRDKENQQQDVTELSRDTDNANGHIDKIFDKEKVQEQQELAALFGQMANQAAGDIGSAMGWAADSKEKAAIHGIIGALQAGLGGGNALAGGVAGLSSEAFSSMVNDYLGSHTSLGSSEKSAIVQWAAALSGAAIGGVIGGTNGAQSGAAASLDSVRYNYLNHQEAERKKQVESQLQKGDLSSEERQSLQQELADINATDKSRDQQILDVCTQGNKSSGACGQLVVKAQKALEGYGDSAAGYRLSYKDIFPQDYANADAIMKGLDAGSITRDAAIKGIVANNPGKTWDEVARTYDDAMQTHAIVSIIAGSKLSGDEGIFGKDKISTGKISPENQKYVDILSPEAKQHILYGDGPGGGGHLYPGQPGKTVFPKEWAADKVVHEVGDIATSPNTQWYAQTGTGGIYTSKGKPANWVSYEERDGIRIRVVYQPATGRVVTAFPDTAEVPTSYKPIKK